MKSILYIVTFFISGFSLAQDKTSHLYHELKVLDSLLFDRAFNQCETRYLEELISEDFEFYHDQAGITNSKEDFLKGIKNGICNPSNSTKSRRELIKESLIIYPLYNNGELYGALQNGNHKFFETNYGIETLGSIAMFSHLWIIEDNSWKLKRVISYDHKSQHLTSNQAELILDENILKTYTGTYIAEKTGLVTLSIKENILWLSAGKMNAPIYPKELNIFFHKEAPLVFKFLKNEHDEIYKMLVIENGNIIESAIKKL